MPRYRCDGFFGPIEGPHNLVRGVLHTRDFSLSLNAEAFLFRKLRQGVHPDLIAWEVQQELRLTPHGSYRYRYLHCILDMHFRLHRAGCYTGLPTLAELEAVERIVDKRIQLEEILRDRFQMETMASMIRAGAVTQEVFDDGFDLLDAIGRRHLPQMRGRNQPVDHALAVETESLRRAVADLTFRVESAEARIDTDPRRFGPPPPASFRPPVPPHREAYRNSFASRINEVPMPRTEYTASRRDIGQPFRGTYEDHMRAQARYHNGRNRY